MSNEKRSRIIVWGMVLVLGVVPLVYSFSRATPDVQAEVVGLIVFVVIGIVAFVQISGSRDEDNYPWKK